MKIYYLILLILIISCKNPNYIEEKSHTNAPYEKATEYRDKNILDSAFLYYNDGKEEFIKNDDSIGIAKALINMSVIMSEKGDFYGSIETAIEARKVLTNKDSLSKNLLASNLNTLAISSKELKNFSDAILYYKEAITLSNEKNDRLAYLNNIGDAYLHLEENETAISYFQKALETTDSIDYARALNNLGKAEYLKKNKYGAIKNFEKALLIRTKKNNNWGLNSSFASLSDFYFNENNEIKSLFYAQKMYEISKRLDSPDDQIEALQKLILLEKSETSKSLFKIYQKLNDSLQTSRGKSRNQFALIRFETEKSKADNLKLQKDNTEKNYLIFSISTIFLIIGSIGLIYYRKRKKRLQQEKQLEVKNTELKYSKKVHDVVANGLYHLMIDIDNNPDINKVKILNDMEKMYEESRDISHDKSTEIDFHERFGKMINSYSTAEQKVILTKYAENIWENIPQNTQSELFYVVREFLVNMKKHSEAKMVVLKFEKDDNIFYITYTDNGKGIKNLATQRGSGIRNTENRIDTIGGDIIFEENPNGGLIIKITIPIHSKYV